jgi:hypothetical protein
MIYGNSSRFSGTLFYEKKATNNVKYIKISNYVVYVKKIPVTALIFQLLDTSSRE